MGPVIAIIVVLIIILAVIVYIIINFNRAPPKEKTLYERLGGIYAISAVIDHFSDNVIKNPKVGRDSPNPQLREWSRNKAGRLPGLKFMRTLWVSDVAGGPFKFRPSSMSKCPFGIKYFGSNNLNLKNAHCPLKITSEEFDEVARELSNSLDHFKVPTKEKGEVLAAFAAHKGEVVGVNGFLSQKK